jgi:hypothetical protein
MTREAVLEAQRLNAGTRIFAVEHACVRPRYEGSIYDPTLIDRCIVERVNLVLGSMKIVGVDWGLTECGIVLLGEWRDHHPEIEEAFVEGVCIVASAFLHGRLVDAVVAQIRAWQLLFGDDVKVRADGNSPYNNRELHETYGYWVRAITGDKGDQGKANVARWLASGRLKILAGNDMLVTQMKNVRRDMATGKQIKKNKQGEEGDHGPDAARFALTEYDFIKWWHRQEAKEAPPTEEEEKAAQPPPKRRSRVKSRRGGQNLGAWHGKSIDQLLGW